MGKFKERIVEYKRRIEVLLEDRLNERAMTTLKLEEEQLDHIFCKRKKFIGNNALERNG